MNQETIKNPTKSFINNRSKQETRSMQELPLSIIVVIKYLQNDEENPNKAMKRLVLELNNGNSIRINSQCLTQRPGTFINFQCLNNQIYTLHEEGIFYFVKNQNLNPGDVFLTENNLMRVISTSEPPKFIVVKEYPNSLPFEDKDILYRSGNFLMIRSTNDCHTFMLHKNAEPAPNNSVFSWDKEYFKIKYFSLDPN
jgi:hypothetical protein